MSDSSLESSREPGARARNLKLTIQYDGTSFHGWQAQPGCRTVEGVLEDALGRLEGAIVDLHGASRTDQGVHALGQTASFHAASPIPTGRYAVALNGRLPPDVRVSSVEDAPPDFHARFSAAGKCYRYLVDRRVVPSVLLARYALHAPGPLDLAAMRRAAAHFLGEQDFASYQCESGNPPETTVRTIHAVLLQEDGGLLAIEVWGRSFLYKMVRAMVGSLLEVGRGKWLPERIRESLIARDRRAAGPTLPAHGLCLLGVWYSAEAMLDRLSTRNSGERLCDFGILHVA